MHEFTAWSIYVSWTIASFVNLARIHFAASSVDTKEYSVTSGYFSAKVVGSVLTKSASKLGTRKIWSRRSRTVAMEVDLPDYFLSDTISSVVAVIPTTFYSLNLTGRSTESWRTDASLVGLGGKHMSQVMNLVWVDDAKSTMPGIALKIAIGN